MVEPSRLVEATEARAGMCSVGAGSPSTGRASLAVEEMRSLEVVTESMVT